jgi:hypothetical protein
MSKDISYKKGYLMSIAQQIRELPKAYKFFAVVVGLVATFNLAKVSTPLFTNDQATIKALENKGFKPIKVGGGNWLPDGISSDEYVRTKFQAVSQEGDTVAGYAGYRSNPANTLLHFDNQP